MVGEARPTAREPVLLADRVATIAIDQKGVVLEWDDGAAALFKYPPNEALGVALTDLIIPARLRSAYEAGLRRLRHEGLAPVLDTHLDAPVVDGEGREFHVDVEVTRRGGRFVGRMRELPTPTPLNIELYLAAKGFERRERIETARMTTLIEALNVGILLQDEQQRVVLTNSAFVEFFTVGLTPDKLRGTAPRGGSFTHAFADREAAERRIAETVRRGRPSMGDEVRLAGGLVLERDYVPVTLDGATLGHLWVFRDVTAQAEIRRGLEERNRMLTEVSDLKTEFVRVASHELRTPLTSIATFSSMLEQTAELDPADRDLAVTAIRRNAERMQVLVTDLLLLAQLESGETSLCLAPTDLTTLLSEACRDASIKVSPARDTPPERSAAHEAAAGSAAREAAAGSAAREAAAGSAAREAAAGSAAREAAAGSAAHEAAAESSAARPAATKGSAASDTPTEGSTAPESSAARGAAAESSAARGAAAKSSAARDAAFEGSTAREAAFEGDAVLLRQLFATAVGVVAAAADPGAPVTVTTQSDEAGWMVEVRTETAEPATAERLLSTRLPHPDASGEQRTGALALMLAREIAARHGGKLTSAVTDTGMTVRVHLPTR